MRRRGMGKENCRMEKGVNDFERRRTGKKDVDWMISLNPLIRYTSPEERGVLMPPT